MMMVDWNSIQTIAEEILYNNDNDDDDDDDEDPHMDEDDEDPHTEAQKEELHDEKTYTVSASVKTNSKNIGPYSDLLVADYLAKEGRNIGPYSDLLVADYASKAERNKNERRQVWEEKFQELLQFREHHGHCSVPNYPTKDCKLRYRVGVAYCLVFVILPETKSHTAASFCVCACLWLQLLMSSRMPPELYHAPQK